MNAKYTLVQHSGAGYKGDYRFARGVETRGIESPEDLDRVQEAGGLLFSDYSTAEDTAHDIMYPKDYFGLIPKAPGRFSDNEIDGLRIYIPVESPRHGPIKEST